MSEFEFEITDADFRVMPIIAICGKSGSGKTYSALLFARGYVGATGKICVIDTEKGRCEAYGGGRCPEIGDFKKIIFQAPFTPERYIAAYRKAAEYVGENGFVVIDSTSHEWEGEGGICDMAEQETQALIKRGKSASLNVWNKPKQRHKKFVNEFSNPIVPTILCLKMKTVMKPVKGGDPVEITDIIAEKNFHYEMTTILEIVPKTHQVNIIKNPLPLKNIIESGFTITPEIGKMYAEKLKAGKARELDTIDEIQVKIAMCDTEEELKSACGLYKSQNHPLMKEIVNLYNQQLNIINTMQEPVEDFAITE